MIKKINYRFALIFLSAILMFNFFPVLLLAADPVGLVPCGTGPGASPTDCQWKDLVKLAQNIVDFIFFDLIIPLSVIAIVYAGIQVLMNQDNPGQLTKAYGTLKNVGIGIFMSLGAYAIVKTIVTLFAREGSTFQEAITKVFG